MKTIQYLKNVASLKLDVELCTGCGLCVIVCPHAVFELKQKKAMINDINDCMECGACEKNCQYGAISVNSGVGCAAAIINGILSNSEPSCGYSDESNANCC